MSLSSAVRPTSMVMPSGETKRRATLRPCQIPFSGSGGGGALRSARSQPYSFTISSRVMSKTSIPRGLPGAPS